MSVSYSPCHHLKANGVWCGSPALRGHRYCYFHHAWRETRPKFDARRKPTAVELPVLEDANAVQVALQRLMQAVLADQVDSRKAGLLLYALQTAASNLKNTQFESCRLKDQATADYADAELDPAEEDDDACTICADQDEERLPR